MVRDEKLLSKLRLHQLDELFVQQHVVRRFQLNHADEFNTLQSLRKELEDCLRNLSPDHPDHLLLSWQLRTSQLAQCINHFDTKANLRLIATGERDAAYQNFLEDLDAGGSGDLHLLPLISRVLATDDDACSALFEILLKHAKPVLAIVEQLNFLDYYSPLAMTSLASGASIYESYIKAKVRTQSLSPSSGNQAIIFPEGSWLLDVEAAMDDDLYPLIFTYCYRRNKPSKNIRIFGGGQHDVTVNGEAIDNCLIFCVPTDQTPDRIDESLRYFRDVLAVELSSNFFYTSDKDAPSFQASRFMTEFSCASLLMENWDQVQKNIVSLWAWDLVNINESRAKKSRVIDVPGDIAKEMQSLKNGFEHDFEIYTERTIKHFYEEVTLSIGSINAKRQSSLRQLDRFVTGDEIILGKRNNP